MECLLAIQPPAQVSKLTPLPHLQLTARGSRRVSSEHHTRTAQAQLQETELLCSIALPIYTSLVPTICYTSTWLSSASQLLLHG